MKRIILVSSVALMVALAACKGKNKTENADQQAPSSEQQSESTPAASTPANEPKTFAITFAPDSVFLGKKKEVFVRLKNAKGIELADPDGKVTGTEITYEIEVTNKNAVGGNGIFFNPNDFRLQLDNGNNLTHDNYNTVNVDAESTKTSEENKFKLPAGAKPKNLNLFYDETRVSVGVEMK
ncbi:hypothetical protein [Chitinophaga pinensis]|uniref:DUF4352 domain-containing protein n=1 Tax=Chitinophaga pinensis (strain ATCC 43595 / DSM 2588 / LMG 13176 / NBRC 15968 / NCIMB 11800 / UQM 2034) TaxID=485918 RepID=A0A979G8F1_CHIPD|nr:hypothetical protein [Chitinophaga pinensis]ACU62696.1 hypothetical protein Cpin_5265 [Chitinophaga pinensis DSM 2588]